LFRVLHQNPDLSVGEFLSPNPPSAPNFFFSRLCPSFSSDVSSSCASVPLFPCSAEHEIPLFSSLSCLQPPVPVPGSRAPVDKGFAHFPPFLNSSTVYSLVFQRSCRVCLFSSYVGPHFPPNSPFTPPLLLRFFRAVRHRFFIPFSFSSRPAGSRFLLV